MQWLILSSGAQRERERERERERKRERERERERECVCVCVGGVLYMYCRVVLCCVRCT